MQFSRFRAARRDPSVRFEPLEVFRIALQNIVAHPSAFGIGKRCRVVHDFDFITFGFVVIFEANGLAGECPLPSANFVTVHRLRGAVCRVVLDQRFSVLHP